MGRARSGEVSGREGREQFDQRRLRCVSVYEEWEGDLLTCKPHQLASGAFASCGLPVVSPFRRRGQRLHSFSFLRMSYRFATEPVRRRPPS